MARPLALFPTAAALVEVGLGFKIELMADETCEARAEEAELATELINELAAELIAEPDREVSEDVLDNTEDSDDGALLVLKNMRMRFRFLVKGRSYLL